MNQQKLESLMKELREKLTEWPIGAIVWHRASGRRGVIIAMKLTAAGIGWDVMWTESSQGYSYEVELSKTPVKEDEDWQQQET